MLYTNAFNCLNHQTALRNISIICPSFARILINTYCVNSLLYIDGDYILSQEGTTQGDPLAMPMYALGVVPGDWLGLMCLRSGMLMMPLLGGSCWTAPLVG